MDDLHQIACMSMLKLYKRGYYINHKLLRQTFVNDLLMELRKYRHDDCLVSYERLMRQHSDDHDLKLIDTLEDVESYQELLDIDDASEDEAMTMGDRIVVMKDGIIQQVDTPQNLYDMPCNMFVAGFIGSPQMNFLDGTVTKNGDQYAIDLGGDTIPLPKEKTADGKLDSYVGKKVKMGIRPEDIDDEPEFMAKHPDCHLEAQVDVSEMMGAEIYLYLEYKGNKMTARVAPTSKARNGDTVRVAFDPHKVHLFDVETEQTILN